MDERERWRLDCGSVAAVCGSVEVDLRDYEVGWWLSGEANALCSFEV